LSGGERANGEEKKIKVKQKKHCPTFGLVSPPLLCVCVCNQWVWRKKQWKFPKCCVLLHSLLIA